MDVSLVARKWPDSGCDASSQRQDSGYKMGVKLVASGYKGGRCEISSQFTVVSGPIWNNLVKN